MVKLVDTPDLGSGAVRCVGSSPILGKFCAFFGYKMNSNNVVTHLLICDEPWFSFIREGVKPVEGRKNSPKFQKIKIGDFIDFSNGKENFLTLVTEIRVYSSLEEYLEDVTLPKALPNVASLSEAIKIYHQWSTPKEIKTYGFLGIFIKLISDPIYESF